MSAYCFKCCELLSGSQQILDHPDSHDSYLRAVTCLVCLDSGEVSVLGEEILCPRKCEAAKRIRESYDKLNLNFEQYLERTRLLLFPKEKADEQKS